MARGTTGIWNMNEAQWSGIGKPGLYRKAVRLDATSGKFLGLLRFDADARSGVHRHVDVAVTYILAGSVTDYLATFRQGEIGINPPGDTHDALSYDGAVMVSRLEGTTLYPEQEGELKSIHPGAYEADLGTIAAERAPIIAPIASAARPLRDTGYEGVLYRLLYDYADTGHDFRMTSLHFQAGAKLGPFQTQAPLDLFVIAGDLTTEMGIAPGNHFVTVDAGRTVNLGSRFGCHLLAWSEARVQFETSGRRQIDPFGFQIEN